MNLVFLALLGMTSASRDVVEASKNPVARIVTLLNGLKAKLEEDLKAETDLYETYVCWYKTTTTTKTASNEAASSRIDSLESYIKDIEAGRIEFTTERQDTEKQIAGLKSDLEQAKTMRENEKKDFEAAKAEMEQAVSALDKAVLTMDEGTKGSFAQKRSYIDMLSARHSIQKSMVFAGAFLDASDRKYLEQYINGDPPKKDWKKLNSGSSKMKYKSSSGKIIETLKKLQTTFKGNLADAIKEEDKAVAAYEKLSGSKGDMLDKANTALNDATLEGGARGQSKDEAQGEVDALNDQMTADKKFISEAKQSFETKEGEWEGRKELRSKEVLAMSQAIAVLASDDAKDLMKDSFKSQGYLFLQEFAAQSEPQLRAKCAARIVQSLASKTRNPELALLAVTAGNEQIEKVVKKVDEIIQMKKKEEKEDLDKKEKCETDLSDAASKARTASLAIDTASEDVTRASGQIEELKAQLKEQEEKKTGLQGQVKDIKRQREDENTEFKNAKLQVEKAVALVDNAINIMKDWKNAKKAALVTEKVTPKLAAPTAPEGIMPAPAAKVATSAQAPHRLAATAIKVHTAQKSSNKQAPQFQSDAGAAPVPPPATWDSGAEYKGAGEQGGIVGILELVKDDMKKDITSAQTDEKQAVKDFEKTNTDLNGEIKACDDTISAYNKDKAAKEKTVSSKTEERSTKKGELESQIKLYQGYKPGCDFLLVNFVLRTQARQTEVDGLEKAKAILKGAKFGKSFVQEMC